MIIIVLNKIIEDIKDICFLGSVTAGYQFSSDYIAGYLRHALPRVPEEGHR